MADQDWKASLVSKLPEHMMLFILGIAIVVLAIVGGVTYKQWLPVAETRPRVLLVIFGFLLIGLGFYVRRTSTETTFPTTKDYGITISHPQAGDKVGKTDVRGTIKTPLPRGYSLWVFRIYTNNGLWPLRECVITDNNWEARDCDVGGTSGDKRVFSANLIGPDGSALIAYVQTAMERLHRVRDELIAKTGNTSAPLAPLIYKRTRDMLECAWVKIERS